MKIDNIEIELAKIKLKRPYTIAYKTTSSIQNIFIKIILNNGMVGFGSSNVSKYVVGLDTSQSYKNAINFKNELIGKNISYLWCLSKYPTEPKDLKNFPKNFKKSNYDGYSDHSIGIETCLIAISRGAKIIEKHFTLDKSNTTIRDHTLSATPKEFKLLVDIGRDISKKINIGI